MRLDLLAIVLLAACQHAAALSLGPFGFAAQTDHAIGKHNKHKKQFRSPAGYFIQERASKQLPGPGQHFSYGALQPWHKILKSLKPNQKLLFLVRHGQAVSNWLSDTLGPDEWFTVEETCVYKAKDGTRWPVFDAELTELGQAQAKALNSELNGGGWFKNLTGGLPTRAVVSPLSRCLSTATMVLDGLPLNKINVEESVRETLGEDTCDARRSASDPDGTKAKDGPCPFEQGLAAKFPLYSFPVGGWDKEEFGLYTDADQLWTKGKREKQHHQVKRATAFLQLLFSKASEQVIFVITHSGFTRSLLLAVGREPYRPVNAELVPVIVTDTLQKGWSNVDPQPQQPQLARPMLRNVAVESAGPELLQTQQLQHALWDEEDEHGEAQPSAVVSFIEQELAFEVPAHLRGASAVLLAMVKHVVQDVAMAAVEAVVAASEQLAAEELALVAELQRREVDVEVPAKAATDAAAQIRDESWRMEALMEEDPDDPSILAWRSGYAELMEDEQRALQMEASEAWMRAQFVARDEDEYDDDFPVLYQYDN